MNIVTDKGFGLCRLMLILLAILMAFSSPALAQHQPQKVYTVYAIADLHSTFTPEFHLPVYGIEGESLFFVHELRPDNHDGGPIGLAVDPIHSKLFVTYEDSRNVDIFDARNAEQLGQISLQGTSDLAGIDVLPSRNQFFVVDRGETDMFVFDSETYQPVNHWFLGGSQGAYGIDVVENVDGEDVVFVGDGTPDVYWYSIDTHLVVDKATFTANAIAVAVDNSGPSPVVYSTAVDPGHDEVFPEDHTFLQKFDSATGIETRASLPACGVGLAVNEYERVIYISTGYLGAKGSGDPLLLVYDMDNLTQKSSASLNFCSGSCEPTDVVSTQIAFGSRLEKKLISHEENEVIQPGEEVVFEITYTNESTYTLASVALQDTYNIGQLSYSNAVPASDDSTDDGEVNWKDLTDTFGEDLAPGESYTIEVHFTAKESTCEGTLIGVNVAETLNVRTDTGKLLPSEEAKAPYELSCIPKEETPPPEEDDDQSGVEDDDVVGDDDADKDLWPEGSVTGGCCGC